MHRHNWQPLEPGRVKCKSCDKVSVFGTKYRDKVTGRKMVVRQIPGIRQVTWEEIKGIVCNRK